MSLRSPFPIPFGWFQVAWPGDVKVGQVVPLQYFGHHLALWRDDDGVAHVNDAFCPHLGAHFGHGGSVDGEDLVCPFHGWRFDADGPEHPHPLLGAPEQEGLRHARTPRSSATA